MKILLVEDDEDKREQLIKFIIENYNVTPCEARSYNSAVKAIKEDSFDLILLDMTMPTFDISAQESGGRSQPFGGKMILYELVRREIITKVIVITQFDIFGKGNEEITLRDLDTELMELFSVNYIGAIQYSIKYSNWKALLLDKIKITQ